MTAKVKRRPWGSAHKWLADHANYQSDDCIEWPFSRIKSGYTAIKVNGRQTTASRILCEVAHGAPPTPKHEACHTCGNGHRGCMNRNHLYWGTKSQNQIDRVAQGTAHLGESNHRARLRESDIREIRALAVTQSQSDIGNKFGISQTHVSNIIAGNRWGWLQ